MFFSIVSIASAQEPALTFRLEPSLPTYYVGQQVTGIISVDAGGYELHGNTGLSNFATPPDAVRYGSFSQRKGQNTRLAVYATPIIFLSDGELVFAPAIDGQVALTETRGIFQSRKIVPFKAAAPPLRVRVRTLPRENQPAEFCGAVGVFKLNATLEPRVCSPGDVLNLRWTLTGESAFNSPQTIKYSAGADFRVYAPKPDPASAPGAVVCSQDIIPNNTNATSAAALEVCVFNPVKRAYETLRAGPFPLEISERVETVHTIHKPVVFTNGNERALAEASKKEPFSFADLFRRRRGETIVAPVRADAKLLPDAHSKTLFEIPAGASLEIRARRDGWLFV
ncbi:MAG: hypothetical protein FWG05_05400, partial [Kiritimatiellaeota bacterium]|nr:hypothetical protein [Kiritimatiellota bacterium]